MFGDGDLDVLYESETEKIKRIRRVVTLVTMISRIMGKERKYDPGIQELNQSGRGRFSKSIS